MNIVSVALALLSFGPALQAAETAYSALRVVGREQGAGALNRVIEMRGRFGAPEPDIWRVTLEEGNARGGIRDIEVQRNRILSQKTPAARSGGSPMNFNSLNLDSEGAFTIANQEARKTNVAFDRIDYTLRGGAGGGAPVWTLDLLDRKAGKVGSFQIAADSGEVLRQNLRGNGDRDRDVADDRDAADAPRNRDRERDRDEESPKREQRYTAEGNPSLGVDDFLFNLGKRFERRGNQMKNFFTGRGFVDERERR